MKNNKKFYIKIALLVAAEIILALVYSRLGGFGMNNKNDNARHLCQLIAALSAAIMFYALWLIYKYFLLPAVKKGYIRAKAGIIKALKFISRKIGGFLNKIGIGGRRRLAIGKDEYTFIFDEDKKENKRLFVGNVNRWKNLTDNNQKLRFLFIRYMMKRIRRGYRKRRGKTPREWAKELGVRRDALELFENYDIARYCGGKIIISDDAVERAKKVCDSKPSKGDEGLRAANR